MDVLRLFGAELPDVAHYFVHDGYKFANSVIVGGREYDFTEEMPWRGVLEFKRYAKRFCKLALYKALR